MKENCLDIGMIQAFLDGELAHTESARVSSHLALCDGCATMLADAENESAIVFPALEREFNSLVPTQRLWTKINESIVDERDALPFWHKAWAYVSIALANPSLTSAAGLLLAVTVGVVILSNLRTAVPDVAVIEPPITRPSATIDTVKRNDVSEPGPEVKDVRNRETFVASAPRQGAGYERAVYRSAARVKAATPVASVATEQNASTADTVVTAYVPGEETYVKTIASLSLTVDETKDIVMRPAQRIAYERDMAVVNDAIGRMQKEVRRNPKNESARQVLYSSYQNKIDLLNSVSQKEELMVSMR